MVSITLSERERLNLIEQGDHIFLEVQERLYDAKRQRITENKDKLVTTLDTLTVFGSLDEVTELFLNDEKKMVLDYSESLDIVVLKPPTPERPRNRTSLRWSLSRTPSRLLAQDQDYCYLEVMKPYGTQDGRRGWARVSHSIEHKACPEPKSHVIRAELLYCGLFFEETDELGVLNATAFYNIKSSTASSVLMPMVQKARGKRTVELLNHYLKMSHMILRSKKISLTRALQLQGEKRCTACANYLSMWKFKNNCVMCGSYLCDKCSDIVVRNYRIDGVTRGQVACFACSHRRGKKISQTMEISDEFYALNNGPVMDMNHDDGLRDKSISSFDIEQCPKWFDDVGTPSQGVAQDKPKRLETWPQQPATSQSKEQQISKPTSRSSEFVPQQTFFMPNAEAQRKRCSSRATSQHSGMGQEKDFVGRHRSRTTGNSRLSKRAKPTSCAPWKDVHHKSNALKEESVNVALNQDLGQPAAAIL
ncbi:Zinc finger, RING/FYVE/PHD-type [Plasmopara halstedii]|uniref:Zinc finger, RING/FYVE/PHD-type n=1 Tax=Plasmopara halstedii TaxID=4781 RepID=A0A0P1AQF2_PLAHL|nr:Zinc finger, RING/FYVE/PHD-type [Plasmopara halstedii]CEG43073.1 Zinc finger, RING/FYVE/PHD-type [Plasmopara halstedii]|eukprot:XP_024579442.1 Zinc finger, RING/FYVE/PHD-type [Plasmopara halstedii]